MRPQEGDSFDLLKNGFFIFLYRNVALYYVSRDL